MWHGSYFLKQGVEQQLPKKLGTRHSTTVYNKRSAMIMSLITLSENDRESRGLKTGKARQRCTVPCTHLNVRTMRLHLILCEAFRRCSWKISNKEKIVLYFSDENTSLPEQQCMVEVMFSSHTVFPPPTCHRKGSLLVCERPTDTQARRLWLGLGPKVILKESPKKLCAVSIEVQLFSDFHVIRDQR